MACARFVELGDFKLDHTSGELSRNGRKVRLPTQSLQILLVLLEHPGELVTRDELRERLWTADTFVDFDAGLNNAVKKLRDALEDSSEHPRFIETIPRRGYRLIVSPAVPEPARPRRRVLVGVGVLASLAIGVGLSLGAARSWLVPGPDGTPPPAIPPAAIRSIVVLPFENLSGDPALDYVVASVGDALATYLKQIGTLRVSPPNSARHYKGTSKRPADIMRELDVDAAVSGSFTRAGDRLIVRAQLVRAPGDHLLWTEEFESEAGDSLAWQGKTARAIAQAVHLQTHPDEQRLLARARPVDPEAQIPYNLGRLELSLRRADATQRAVKFFEEAIAKDPQYAQAYSGLSDAYYRFDLQGVAAPAEAMPKAEQAANDALALDNSLAEAYSSLGSVSYRYKWNWRAAQREFRESILLKPDYVEARRAYGIYLQTVRQFDESVEQHRIARDLSPHTLDRHVEYVGALFRAGRPKEAYAEVDRVRELFSRPTFGAVEIAYDLVFRQRNWPAAIGEFEKNYFTGNEWLGFAYAKVGRTSDARAMLAAYHDKVKKGRYVSPLQIAIVHFGLGEGEEGFAWLEKSLDERAMDLRNLTIGLFSFLHDDPRFQEVLRRMGLADLKEFKTP
jgi:DNA-binding winged helix-turn-helix (wHTH) protein/TolB-like protein/Tfp pilus assembly protein PilF